jgi:D-3-phosphoglycerate dehydrogenase
MRPRVHITEPIHPEARALLMQSCDLVEDPAQAQAILVRTARLGNPGPGLRLVAKHGVGVDNLDLAALAAAGVAVMNTPGANAGAVAEHALMLMLALTRDLAGMEHAARSGARLGPVSGLAGKRLLVVGHGASGRRLAGLAGALGVQVTVFGPRLRGTTTDTGLAIAPDLASGLAAADIVSLHCPLTAQTRGMIGAGELALMPPGSYLVNCARGGIVDEAALVMALTSGHLAGAALDCTEVEPLPQGHPLLEAPRLILTPHMAAASAEAFREMGMQAARNVLAFFAGQPDPGCMVAT